MCQQQVGWAVEEDCMDVMGVERRTKMPGGRGATGQGDAEAIGPVAPASRKIVNSDTHWDYRQRIAKLSCTLWRGRRSGALTPLAMGLFGVRAG